MATHTQMARTAANPDAVAAMAAFLLRVTDAEWTDWELDFLEHMGRHAGPDPISMRQREVLFELNDQALSFREYRGLSVRHLLARCWLARADLEEDEEAFIVGLYQAKRDRVRRATLLRLVSCARKLGVIDAE